MPIKTECGWDEQPQSSHSKLERIARINFITIIEQAANQWL